MLMLLSASWFIELSLHARAAILTLCGCVAFMQGLRSALQRLRSSSSFEDLLCGADAAGSAIPKLALPELLPVSLLRRPHIFTLAIVWESMQVR